MSRWGPFEADHLKRYQKRFLTVKRYETSPSILDGNPRAREICPLEFLDKVSGCL